MAGISGKTRVKADITKNRLCFTIAGLLTKKDLDRLYTDVRFCVSDLKEGFDVITDLTDCRIAHLTGVVTFRKIMNYLIASQVGNIVRVVRRENLLYKQIINLTSRIQGYRPLYVSSLEEAEELLGKLQRRKGLRLSLHTFKVALSCDGQGGEGFVENISTSGCSIKESTLEPVVGQEVALNLSFLQKDGGAEDIEVQSTVVRTEENSFAVEYSDLSADVEKRLWDCLVAESQKELN